MSPEHEPQVQPSLVVLMIFGATVGVLSGLLGIGGGVVLVPLMVSALGYTQRLAAGTSIAAILPPTLLGGISYAVQGHVDWLVAVLLAGGVVIGAQLGSYMLSRTPTVVLRWLFMAFLLAVFFGLWIVIPVRDAVIDLTLGSGAALVLLGLAPGVFSGLLGVGGGVIVVSVLIFFVGSSDLIAKGSSLIVMIPGSISGTLRNVRRKNIDLRAALVLGLSAGVLSPVGTIIAAGISPFWSNVVLSILVAVVLAQMLAKTLRSGNIMP